MNEYFLGIDLGSTTCKAVVSDKNKNIKGKGLTNIRSDYQIAFNIAKELAVYNVQINALKEELSRRINPEFISSIEKAFYYHYFLEQLNHLYFVTKNNIEKTGHKKDVENRIDTLVNDIFSNIRPKVKDLFFSRDIHAEFLFFRDIITDLYYDEAEIAGSAYFDMLMALLDKSLVTVENKEIIIEFRELIKSSLIHIDYLNNNDLNEIEMAVNRLPSDIQIKNMVGTGYGRALLPFPEKMIKSEILCHGLGAHFLFPGTRTILDIGGQDMKAIQTDSEGMVTSFQMNDRCAAGCGRYLNYMADVFNIPLNELGANALRSGKSIPVNSTCTVFAGAEVRELLNQGETKEDILKGLHDAIVKRAVSLIARSGGVKDEFTFSGGVSRNKAIVKYLNELVHAHYGKEIKMNVHTDSIFTGAIGAAFFAVLK